MLELNLYPKLVVGKNLVQKILSSLSKESKLYVCEDISSLKEIKSELYFMPRIESEIFLYLCYPTRQQYDSLLKFLEETKLKLVLVVPYDNVPSTVVSRCPVILKDEDIIFRDYLDTVVLGKNIKRKVFELFGRVYEDNEGG